jgi:outer membrane protein TolC
MRTTTPSAPSASPSSTAARSAATTSSPWPHTRSCSTPTAIAVALRDVSNALIAYNKTREYREQQEKQTAATADAVRLARIRYNAGYTSYLEVLTNDANLYSSQLTLATAQQQEALALVQLYNALGGGW